MKPKIYILFILIVICFNACNCPNCHNGKKDGDEIGIDCGGYCPECPPSVTTLPATAITLNTATVAMQYNGYSILTSIGVCYDTSHNPTISSSFTKTGAFSSPGDFIQQISGLTPHTTYFIRGYVKNKYAIAYGNELSFTTNSTVPILPSVTTTPATAVTVTSATSGGNVTSDGGATVTARGICYSTSINPTVANTVIVGGAGVGSFTSSITGLTTLNRYYVTAFATNSVGTAYGNQISFTAKDPTVPTLTTTSAFPITTTSAISGGNISSDGGAIVTARGICYNTTGNPTTASSLVSGGSGTGGFSCNLTGLSAVTNYYVRAYAVNSVGTAYGNQISFVPGSPYYIGRSYGGGRIAYVDSTGLHGLIAAPADQSTSIYWHITADGTTGAQGKVIGTGNANTTSIIALYGTENNAARICYDLVLNGYSDWYLPSKDELYQLYINRVKISGFANDLYWSSTEYSSSGSYYWDYKLSGAGGVMSKKATGINVRAVRSF